jgi:NAD-dependent deacetylase sirtuin 4
MFRASPLARRLHLARQVSDFLLLSAQRRPPAPIATDAASSPLGGAVVITGAGVSTASGIPDYRGPQGLYEKGHRPMTFQRFTSGPDAQRRYYARSFLGYPTMCLRKPNPAHVACASLLQSRAVGRIITQNVDGLHQESIRVRHGLQQEGDYACRSTGADDVSELHGNIHRVRCLHCGHISRRAELQHRLAEENHKLLTRHPELARAGRLPTTKLVREGHIVGDDNGHDATLELASEKPSRKDRLRPPGTSVNKSNSAAPDAATRSSTMYYEREFVKDGSDDGYNPGKPNDNIGLDRASVKVSEQQHHQLRPDGDFEASQGWIDEFKLVPCTECGEFSLKPDMVFFGESTDPAVVQRCFHAVENASCLLCVGTSMQVFSAYRFVIRAKDRGVPVAILNSGPTRADKDAALKIEGPVEEVLPYIALRLQTWHGA